MATTEYNPTLCRELQREIDQAELHKRYRPSRYEPGDVLLRDIEAVFPATRGKAELTVEKFLGGGFAGQVYRCRLTGLVLDGDAVPGLEVGRQYAVKIIVPPTGFSRLFRNTIYWLAFQGPFSSQVNYAACRSGLLWQKLARRAGRITFGRDTAVKDAYASFWDDGLNAYGEITEWVEGRTWLLEADPTVRCGVHWRTADLDQTHSPEFIAKRRFMAAMVAMMHEMGAPEFARQYEWWTMKSQPNVLNRTDVDDPPTPESGLCAIDFRAGLALLPFLPMSPGDIKLILDGLFRRRTLVQFDRSDLRKLDEYVATHSDELADMDTLLCELRIQDAAYRRSLPDVTHHGLRLLTDCALRKDVRAGLVEGYEADDLVDADFAQRLRAGGFPFCVFYVLGAFPVVGRLLRRLWGNTSYRRHVGNELTSPSYLARVLRTKASLHLIEWHRTGRVSEERARRLHERPVSFWVERLTCGLIPLARLHRCLTDWSYPLQQLRAISAFSIAFFREPAFREKWFVDSIDEGHHEGMLTQEERDTIVARVKDPFIVKYLECLAVHFATLPVTQIVSVIVGGTVAGWMLANGEPWEKASAAFAGILLLFQFIPISPGSLCRGGFVVYLMVRERNIRDYLVAAPLSFVKYIGYLAFPLQMVTTYPSLASFLAGSWAAKAAHVVPVFGEKGALLEHWVFDLFFNIPQAVARWAFPRIKDLLNLWLLFGVSVAVFVFWRWELWRFGAGIEVAKDAAKARAIAINIIVATVSVFMCPRLLFFPLLSGRRSSSPR